MSTPALESERGKLLGNGESRDARIRAASLEGKAGRRKATRAEEAIFLDALEQVSSRRGASMRGSGTRSSTPCTYRMRSLRNESCYWQNGETGSSAGRTFGFRLFVYMSPNRKSLLLGESAVHFGRILRFM